MNPVVASASSGGGSPQSLGASTGALTTFQPTLTDQLSVTVTYFYKAGSSGAHYDPYTASTASGPLSLANPPLSYTTAATPLTVVDNAFQVSWSQFARSGQDNSNSGLLGWVHLRVTGLSKKIDTITISNQAGNFWLKEDPAVADANHPVAFLQSVDNTTADVYFPPVRDETKCAPGVDVATDMAMTLTFTGDTKKYVTRFAGGPWDHSLLAAKLDYSFFNNEASPWDVTTASDLSAALNWQSGATPHDTIRLPPNATIILTQPLKINHPVHIIGRNATLKFQASWTNTRGAIVINSDPSNLHPMVWNQDLAVDFDDLNITFDTASSTAWTGAEAVIDLTTGPGKNGNPVFLNLSRVNIAGPPAVSPGSSLQSAVSLLRVANYAGYEQSSGSIMNCTFRGGPIELQGGPWEIRDNKSDGAQPHTLSQGFVGVQKPHDVNFVGNIVSQVVTDPAHPESNGLIHRLVNFGLNGVGDVAYHNVVSGNQFTGGETVVNGQADGGNSQEVVLTEGYQVAYEGPIGSVLDNGWVITLPTPSSTVPYRGQTPGKPGMVVSIVDAANPNAGRWFVIAQKLADSPPTFLMTSPVPAGSYAINIANAFIDDQYLNNKLHLEGTISYGFILTGAQFGTLVAGNEVYGGGVWGRWTGTGIAIGAAPGPSELDSGNFPLPKYWSLDPCFDVIVDSNTIQNFPNPILVTGGITQGEGPTGRVYVKATVKNNTIQWTSQWLTDWSTKPTTDTTKFYGIPTGSGGTNYANWSGDDPTPPSITVGNAFSAGDFRVPLTYDSTNGYLNGYIDPRQINLTIDRNVAKTISPSGTQVLTGNTGQVYSGVINGNIAPSTAYPYINWTDPILGNWHPPGNDLRLKYAPFNAHNLNVNQSGSTSSTNQVDLSSAFNQWGVVGITSPGSSVQGNADQYANSLSSTTLVGNTISWAGQTFQLGPVNAKNMLPAGGQVLNLPQASYSALYLLAMATGFNQAMGQVFQVNYTDNTHDTYTLGVSDWGNGYLGGGTVGTTAPGEAIAATLNGYNNFNSTSHLEVAQAGVRYVYGYMIPVDPSRTVASLSLPSETKIKILALNVVKQGPQVDLSADYNLVGITQPTTSVQGNIDQYANSLSSTALATAANWTSGKAYVWNGQTFNLGPIGANDAIYARGQSLYVPQGSYSALYLLGMSTGFDRAYGGPFRVEYTDGSADQFILGVSDWRTGYNGTAGSTAPGEGIAATLPSYNNFSGGVEVAQTGASATRYVYGYVIPVDPKRIMRDLVLPNENKVKILALNAVSAPPQVNLGATLNQPASGGKPVPFNMVGITEDNNVDVGSLNATQDSFSATALANAANWTSGKVGVWNNQTFNLGPAGYKDVTYFGGQNFDLPKGNYTHLMMLATAMPQPQAAAITVYYVGGSSVTFYQTISDHLTGYTGANTVAPGESIAVQTNYYNHIGTGQVNNTKAFIYGYSFPLDASKTVQYLSLNNNQNMVIFALDLVNSPPQINLGSLLNQTSGDNRSIPFSVVGITADNNVDLGRLNTTQDSFSANALATAANWTSGKAYVWKGQTFNLGPAGQPNVSPFRGQFIDLPRSKYTSLMMLATAMQQPQAAIITVIYDDGTSVTFNQTISDRLSGYNGTPGSTAPGESIAAKPTRYNRAGTGQVFDNSYIYGYTFTLDPTKTVKSLSLNNNDNMMIFALDLVSAPSQVNLGVATDTTSAGFNQVGISLDGGAQYADLDGGGHSYSAVMLGNTIAWNGQVFNVGGVLNNNVIKATGQTVALPHGYMNKLMILGAATNGTQLNQTFTVNYEGGTSDTFTQSISDWVSGYNGAYTGATAPGESIAKSLGHYNYYNGTTSSQIGVTSYVYGYSFTVNSAKVVVSITLPSNSNVKILAINEASTVGTYTPASSMVFLDASSVEGVAAEPTSEGGGDTAAASALSTNDAFAQIAAVDATSTGGTSAPTSSIVRSMSGSRRPAWWSATPQTNLMVQRRLPAGWTRSGRRLAGAWQGLGVVRDVASETTN
ncbi:hypothetical protein [Paludisphaera borealis]|uniref:hypothetical protein n=1 Tax=Paludisphaera borealis TaxID=1387353 RepID=UPI0011AB8AEE|nr:hypothetical protein [Paludisphaera borealis]